jgi:hypothetical protein
VQTISGIWTRLDFASKTSSSLLNRSELTTLASQKKKKNRESATVIEAISAGGQVIPAFLILAEQVDIAQWCQQPELDDDTAVITSASGYSNDEVSLHWFRHFEAHAKAKTVGPYRLLILDGHGSHCTREFVEFCDAHHIVPFGLPALPEGLSREER